MNARWAGVAAIALLAIACTQGPTHEASSDDAYTMAQHQAFELGPVLAGMRACEGDAWEAPFHEFMAAKRERGFDGTQTAMIATLVGATESQAEPEMLECSAEGQSRRPRLS